MRASHITLNCIVATKGEIEIHSILGPCATFLETVSRKLHAATTTSVSSFETSDGVEYKFQTYKVMNLCFHPPHPKRLLYIETKCIEDQTL